MTESWPNNPTWSARHDGAIRVGTRSMNLAVVHCGELLMPTGRLVACDPFAAMRHVDNAEVQVHSGRYPVEVTIADVSAEQDGSHIREAYASLVLRQATEVSRNLLIPLAPGQPPPQLKPDHYQGFVVDVGTACFVDAACLESAMPPEDTWGEGLFENDSPTSWFNQMDDPAHIRDGIANIRLPLGSNGENLILFHSGWGDGVYPLIGGYSSLGELVAVHIDFLVIPDGDD